jgi:hypothetical protein
VHGVGDDKALGPHAAALADSLDLGVEPPLGVGALERALAEGAHLLVEAAAQSGDVVLREPWTPSCSTSRSTFRVLTPLT